MVLKLVSFLSKNTIRPGLLINGTKVIDIIKGGYISSHQHKERNPVLNTLNIINDGAEGIEQLKHILAADSCNTHYIIDLKNNSECKLLAPIPKPHRNVLCIGKNYQDHVNEISNLLPTNTKQFHKQQHGVFFTKAPQCVIGPNGTVPSHSNITKYLDYEAELAVIIGKKGVNIIKEDAMKYVYGYTIANDVTARDLQTLHHQFFKGKSLDHTCPMGPYILLQENMSDVNNLNIKLYINDELRQNSNTKQLIFKIEDIIEQLSSGMTLYPGDIILTGTPAGVGYAMEPKNTLKTNDRIKIEIEQLGTLENVVGL